MTRDAETALSTLAAALAANPELEGELESRFRAVPRLSLRPRGNGALPGEIADAADALSVALPPLLGSQSESASLVAKAGDERANVLIAFCAAGVWRRDLRIAGVLRRMASDPALSERVRSIARERVIGGPLVDALECAPLIGDGLALAAPENAQARARLEILIWEAGASALEVPALGAWIWSSRETFEELIRAPAHGALRGRVLAARCLEVAVRGMPPDTDPELFGKTLQVLQPLLLHPEPLVWVHAARALGRLTGRMEQLEGTVLDWVLGDSRILRQRAMTAFASLPAARLKFLASQLVAILESPSEEAWALAAVAAATPYLFFERRPLWDRLATRILAGDGGAIAARALARGLASLYRRGQHEKDIEKPLRTLREMALRARPTSIDELRRWIEVTAVTDVVDSAERDPLDLELGMENLVRLAAQYDDEEADARAARFAFAVAPTFQEARRIALGNGRPRQRAAAINALEGCARTFALRLWAPLLMTRPTGDPIDPPNLEDTWKAIARAPAEILDLVEANRQAGGSDPEGELPLEVLAIRLGGYALDACEADAGLGPGRGPTAHEICLWLRKLKGLGDGSRELPAPLSSALSMLFWRLVDTTRGTALGEVDDVRWLGPFAAWWALVIDRPEVLLQLATALPMMAPGALERCCERAETLRRVVAAGGAEGQWGSAAAEAFEALHAEDTELAQALADLAGALEAFRAAAGPRRELEALCSTLVRAGERVQTALADPVKALHPAGEPAVRGGEGPAAESTQKVASLVARAIRARELNLLDVWFASLGPVASALLEEAVKAAIRRTPPPPPKARRKEPRVIEGYELVKPLGEGGIGSVWLVRKPGADRLFVLKIPKAEALASATETERDGILASFVEEARVLAGLYHPNVANIIDRGVADGMPFLVLEYLIGADLKQYSAAQLMSLGEVKQVVIEACAGLAALHNAGLVHRDIKPANVWLRLPLAGGEKFTPEKHRDPARAQPLSAVVIDFGMVRAVRVPADACGRFVAGTAGYIAPEQVLDPAELDPRSDVYALAATVYNVTSGRSFFDEIENQRDRIIAHMRRDPFEDGERLRAYPAPVAKVLRAATLRDPADRPSPVEFGRAFAAAL